MLDPDQELRLRVLFEQAIEQPPAERAPFVARSCQDDPALARELEAMLALHDDEQSDFLEAPLVALPDPTNAAAGASAATSRSTAPPPQIDGYEQLEWLAEGGMGSVYKAQQVRPVRRTVALKVIKKGMDSDAVLARFDAERQAMALMSHPYIATVHDAGIDHSGRPFIAMEYVHGQPITDFCAANALSLEQRITLLIKVCQAVEHAHRRGVLHRDLKPSNVLVESRADEAVPKIIDFGIAKAMQGPLGEQSIHTVAGAFLGTPEYMSPEQVDGFAQQIDTRSDVYALGVMLYELLTSELPFAAERLRQASYSQLSRIVHEEAPQKPSTVLRERARTTAAGPRPDTTRWQRRLDGDLDWITLKALAKEPDRRYASARDLAADLDNFLGHRPVSAGPPSRAYRARKFVRRYRVQVTAAALVLVALVVGLFGTLWFLFEANTRAAESEAARRNADGIRLATEAGTLAEENPGLALLLAIEASALTDDRSVRQTIHSALQHHRELRVLVGHDYGVVQVLLHPDGHRLVSRAAEPTAMLWDFDSGALLRRFSGHTDELTCIALDATGRRLLTTSVDGTARIWDVETGRSLVESTGHSGPVEWGAFHPNGELFATASADGTVRICDAHSARLVRELHHGQPVCSLEFDATGSCLVTRAYDWHNRVWDVETGTLEQDFAAGSGPPLPSDFRPHMRQRAMFQPGGDRIVTIDDQMVQGFGHSIHVHSASGEPVYTAPDTMLALFVAGGRELIASGAGHSVRVDLTSGSVVSRSDGWDLIALSADERVGVAKDAREFRQVVDVGQHSVLGSVRGHRFEGYWGTAVFHPDGRRFATTSAGSRVRIWEALPEFAPRDLHGTVDRHTRVLASTSAGMLAVVRDPDPQRALWHVRNIDTGEELSTIDASGFTYLQISRDGSKLFANAEEATTAGHRIARVAVFDVRGDKLREIVPSERFKGFSMRPDGRQLALREPDAGADSFSFFDTDTGERTMRVPWHSLGNFVWWAAPPYDRVTTVSPPELRTEVIEVPGGKVLASVEGPGDEWHLASALSPDGRYLLITLGDLRAMVWDLASDTAGPNATPIAQYTDLETSDAMPCGFADGGRLAWVMCNSEVHLFETVTGETFSVLRFDEQVADVWPTADGRALMTVTIGGICQRWSLDPIAEARRRAQGALERRELDKYHVGTPDERLRRERELLLSQPHPQNWERLGEIALEREDLDEAIRCWQAACDLGPHAAKDVHLYVKLVELSCRRLARGDGTSEQQKADRDHALEALAHALRCKASPEQLLALPGIDALRQDARFDELMSK